MKELDDLEEIPDALPVVAKRRQEEDEEEDRKPRKRKDRGDRDERSSGRFKVRPYEADRGVNPLGVPLLLGLEFGVALLMGVLASLVARLFYLIFLFPLGIGIAVGMAGYLGVRVGKVRNPIVTGLAGFLGGCLAMLTMHFGDYLFFRAAVGAAATEVRQGPMSPRRLGPGRAAEPASAPEPQLPSFFGYLDHAATEGVSIGRGGSGSGFINLGYIGTCIYWLLEVLVVAGVSFLCVLGAALQPFCRRCSTWKTQYKLGHVENPAEEAVESVQEGAVRELGPAEEEETPVRLQVFVCENCRDRAPIEVLVEGVTKKSKDEESTDTLVQMTYPGEALAALQDLFPDANLGEGEGKRRRRRR